MKIISEEKYDPEEDILLKLTMPNRQLRDSTVSKAKDSTPSEPAREVPAQVVEKQAQDSSSPAVERVVVREFQASGPVPVRESVPPHQGAFANVNVKKVEELTKLIMNRDISQPRVVKRR